MTIDPERAERAELLRKRVKEAGLTWAQLRRITGLTRNVIYALSAGRKPREHEAKKIEDALAATSSRRGA